MKTALVILNYNGRKHLENLLPTAIREACSALTECRVVVLDNRSTDDDAAWVERKFPEVEIRVAAKNDFLFSYNDFASEDNSDVLIFLNNDLKLLPGFVAPLLSHFKKEDIFAVSATSRDWDDREFTLGPIRLSHHHGWYFWQAEFERQECLPTLFASGGFMAVDRLKFLQLGGFDRLFFPAYAEDLDLCFRAWRRGWRCIFEPSSVVLHRETGSWGSGTGTRAARLQLRASLLFQWARLPPAAPPAEQLAWFAAESCRRIACNQAWWPATVARTLIEWRSLGSRVSEPRASREDLAHVVQSTSGESLAS